MSKQTFIHKGWLSRQGKAFSRFVLPNVPHYPDQLIEDEEDDLLSPKKNRFAEILQETEREQLEWEEEQAKILPKQTTSFSGQSRQAREDSFRNKTDSPCSLQYNPKYSTISRRSPEAPISSKSVSPRQRAIYMPAWLSKDLNWSFITRKYPKSPTSQLYKNSYTSMGDYENMMTFRLQNNPDTPSPDALKRVPGISFQKQKPRKPFVSPTDPPNEHRFESLNYYPDISSKTRKTPIVMFNKMLKRKEWFSPKFGPALKDKHRSFDHGRNTISFKQTLNRPENVIKQVIDGPDTRIRDLESGIAQTKNRGPTVGRLKKQVPRDDAMYRTNGGYVLNVPTRKLATETPKSEPRILKQLMSPTTSYNLASEDANKRDSKL